MNLSVALFFIHTVVATLIVGTLFARRHDPVFRNFGIAILLDAAAFAAWTVPVFMEAANLALYVSVGTVFFIASMVFLLAAGTQGMSGPARRGLMLLAAVVGAGIYYLGSLPAYPSTPMFSGDGLFFFNVHPLLQALYVIALALVAFPAIEAVVSRFDAPYATFLRYGFIAEVAAGIVLMTSSSVAPGGALAATVAGYVIGVTYFAIWTTLLFKRKAWPG